MHGVRFDKALIRIYLLLTSYFLKSRPDGRTTGALNLGENNFQDVGQIKHSEGYDRASEYIIALQFRWLLANLSLSRPPMGRCKWRWSGRLSLG